MEVFADQARQQLTIVLADTETLRHNVTCSCRQGGQEVGLSWLPRHRQSMIPLADSTVTGSDTRFALTPEGSTSSTTLYRGCLSTGVSWRQN